MLTCFLPDNEESRRDIIFLKEKEIAVLTKDKVRITDFSGEEISATPSRISWDVASAQKSGYPHFMLKEINEQPKNLEKFLKARINKETNKIIFEEQRIGEEVLKNIANIAIVACGTAYHAGFVGKYIRRCMDLLWQQRIDE